MAAFLLVFISIATIVFYGRLGETNRFIYVLAESTIIISLATEDFCYPRPHFKNVLSICFLFEMV